VILIGAGGVERTIEIETRGLGRDGVWDGEGGWVTKGW